MASHNHNSASGNALQINGNISGGAIFNQYQHFQDKDELKKQAFLESLYYDGIDARRQNIPDAAYKTFKWLLDKPGEPFGDENGWLIEDEGESSEGSISGSSNEDINEEYFDGENKASSVGGSEESFNGKNYETMEKGSEEYSHDESATINIAREDARQSLQSWFQSTNESGLFWITGKAASGKSTLMKFICDDSRTDRYLKKWAGDKALVVAEHYFWHPGSPMQKSREGLLRSLMIQICQQCPIDSLFPRRWKSEYESEREWIKPWSTKELWRSLFRLDALTTHKLCLFIDGLDEYHPQDGHDELCNDIRKLAALPNVKLCVSSRPWHAFLVGLQDARSVRLESINRNDLTSYAVKRIGRANPREGAYLNARDFQHLVEDLVDRAEGVFLWLHLVVNSLCERLRTGAKYSELKTRLDEYPPDIEDYLRSMIYQRIHSTWTRTRGPSLTALFLRLTVVLRGARRFPTYWGFYYIAEQANPSLNVLSWSEESTEIDGAKVATEKKVVASCGGFLFMDKHGAIEYTHRTVHDFITSDEMQSELDKNIPQFLFDNGLLYRLTLAVCKLRLLRTKGDHLPDCIELCHAVVLKTHLVGQALLQELDSTLAELLKRQLRVDPFRAHRLACLLLSCDCYSFARSLASSGECDYRCLHMLAWAALHRADIDILGLRREDVDILAVLFKCGLKARWIESQGSTYELTWNSWAISNAENHLLPEFIHMMVSNGGTLERQTIARLETLVPSDYLPNLKHYLDEVHTSENVWVGGSKINWPLYYFPEMGVCVTLSGIRSTDAHLLVPDSGSLPRSIDTRLSASPRQTVAMYRSVFKISLVLMRICGAFGIIELKHPLLAVESLPYDATQWTLLQKAYDESGISRHKGSGIYLRMVVKALASCMAFSNENSNVTNAEVQQFLQEEVLDPLIFF